MAAQKGSFPLPVGLTTVTIPFPVAFVDLPLVLGQVVNVSTDMVKAPIAVLVTDVATNEFTIEVDPAPPTINYAFNWSASTDGDVVAFESAPAQLLTQQKVKSNLGDQDMLVGLDRSGARPRTVQFPVKGGDDRWLKRITTPPQAPNSPGIPGDMAADASYLYVRNASGWRRAPLLADEPWSVNQTSRVWRRGFVSLDTLSNIQEFNFDVPFPAGNAPVITRCVVQNLSGDAALLVLNAMPVATTLTSFKIAITAVPDSANYKMYYEAEQLP